MRTRNKRIRFKQYFAVVAVTAAVVALYFGKQYSAIGSGYSPESREYHLKGAFLRYVAQYVEWPPEVFQESKIHICVLGLLPYYQGINSINGKVVNNHAIQISRIKTIDEAKNHCQIVFVAKTEEDSLKDIIKTTSGLPILLFGDMEGFAQDGGSMNFYIANNRLAIMTNLKAVEKAQLKISPEMMRLVTVVPEV